MTKANVIPGTPLLPCPFCGHSPVLWQIPNDGTWVIGCQTVTCVRPEFESRNKAKAITAWNTRAVNCHSDLVEALEEAHRCLMHYEWYANPASEWASADRKFVRQMVNEALAKSRADVPEPHRDTPIHSTKHEGEGE